VQTRHYEKNIGRMRCLQQKKRASTKHYKETRKEANNAYKPKRNRLNNKIMQIDEANRPKRKERNSLKR